MVQGTTGKSPIELETRRLLDAFCTELEQSLGVNLVSISLYGGLAKGEYSPASSDVNLLIVLARVTLCDLDMLAPSILKASRDFRLTPMLLSERDLHRSTDVFPTKFLDMQRHHQVLRGRDVLSELTIATEHLRLRTEQQIKNLLLRLRGSYLRRSHRPELTEQTLVEAMSPLLSSLAVLVSSRTGQAPAGKRDIIDAAARAFDLDAAVLHRVLLMKDRELRPDAAELRSMYAAFMTLVERVADVVDQR